MIVFILGSKLFFQNALVLSITHNAMSLHQNQARSQDFIKGGAQVQIIRPL